jgi:hypothetical protein
MHQATTVLPPYPSHSSQNAFEVGSLIVCKQSSGNWFMVGHSAPSAPKYLCIWQLINHRYLNNRTPSGKAAPACPLWLLIFQPCTVLRKAEQKCKFCNHASVNLELGRGTCAATQHYIGNLCSSKSIIQSPKNQRPSEWKYCTSNNAPSNFFYSCADLLLLWAENFYTTWRLWDTLKVFCNVHNKKIYNENWKIPTVRQQFIVSGSTSVTARPRTRAA